MRVKDESSGFVWAQDASPSLFVQTPLPSREAFLAQGAGINPELGQQLQPSIGTPVESPSGKLYYWLQRPELKKGYCYYTILLDPLGRTEWAIAAALSPQYDEPAKDGRGFYRGRSWCVQWENLPLSEKARIPGEIVAHTPAWCNLKLEGPAEAVGRPGEEVEVEFYATSETDVPVTTQMGVRREGAQEYAVVLEDLHLDPGEVRKPVRLKFLVESRPYKVRVKINPSETMPIENTYEDNYVDLVVKPLGVDLAVGKGGVVPVWIPWDRSSVTVDVRAVFMRKDGNCFEVPYTAWFDGPAGRKEFSGSFGPESNKVMRYEAYSFTVYRDGLSEYTVRAEIWPEPRELETNPEDNAAVWRIKVFKQKQKGPQYGPREPEIHAELGS